MKTIMKKAVTALAVLSLFAMSVPVVVSAQEQGDDIAYQGGGVSASACSSLASDGIRGVVRCIVVFFNIAIYLMVSGAVVVTMWGAFRMIWSEGGREEGRNTVFYGIIGLFVMVSIWGLVNILDNTFRLSGYGPRTPVQLTPR